MNPEDCLQRYVDHMRIRNFSERTIEIYVLMLKAFFEFLEKKGISDLKTVTAKIVDEYPTYLYYYQDRRGRRIGTATQSKRLTVLKMFYRFLVAEGYVLSSPAEEIQLPRETRPLPVVAGRKEIDRIFAQADTSTLVGYRDRTILELLYATGMRVSEAVNLNLDDVDLAEGLVTIREGKGLKDRRVPLTQIAADYLDRYIAGVRPLLRQGYENGRLRARRKINVAPTGQNRHQTGERVEQGDGRVASILRRALRKKDPNASCHSTALFLNKNGKRLAKNGLWARVKLYVRKARIEKNITPHSIRHTMATDLLRSRADLRHIQEILGHASLRTTQRYTHVVRRDLKKVHEKTHPREKVLSTAAIHFDGDPRGEA